MAHPKVPGHEVADGLIGAFRRSGYAGAGIRELAEATGLKTASLYHRFPTKADMALAALTRAGEGFADLVVAPLEAAGEPGARLRASADGLMRFYEGGHLACLLAVFASSDAPEPVRDAVAAAFARWRDALATALEGAGARDAPAEAEDRIAAVQGALVLARGTGEKAAFARATARMRGLP
jgi:AcrR family transcriptional regulator